MKRVGAFFGKMKGAEQAPTRPHLREILWSWVGGSAGLRAISVIALVHARRAAGVPGRAACVRVTWPREPRP